VQHVFRIFGSHGVRWRNPKLKDPESERVLMKD
jgi:hypothetical protein